MTPPLAPSEGQAMPPGETLSVSERIIVSPTVGVFHRIDGDNRAAGGESVGRGDVIGVVRSLGASTPVLSPFQGLLIAMLASDGERVRPGQAIAWLRGT